MEETPPNITDRYKATPLQILYALLKDYFFAIIGAAVIAFILRIFVIEAYRIPTDYMAPTLIPGDHIFVKKIFIGDLKPGDVVVLGFPNDPTKEYIKRVIAVGGESVEIKDGEVWVNGKDISKPLGSDVFEENVGKRHYQVTWDGAPSESRKMSLLTVPQGQFFALGDNRAKGQDSRSWGFISNAFVKGKASFIWFSKDKSETHWSRFFQAVH